MPRPHGTIIGPLRFGLYAVRSNELKRAKELGVDFVVAAQDTEFLKQTQKLGLKAIVTGEPEPSQSDQAIWGYYLTDEPDLRGLAPDLVRAEQAAARKRTGKPIFLNLSSAHSIEVYREHCDVVMFDWYPVGWQPIETFYSQLRIARLAAREKPFYAVIQAFDWKDYPQLMPANPGHRRPSRVEITAMACWAAMNGASGIAFYPGKNSLVEHPELAEDLASAIQFVRTHEASLRARRKWTPYPFEFSNRADTYNDVFEASIAVKLTEVHGQKNKRTLVAANTTRKQIEVWLRRDGGENARVPVRFQPFEVKFLNPDASE